MGRTARSRRRSISGSTRCSRVPVRRARGRRTAGRPLQGIHPRRTKLAVAAEPGPVDDPARGRLEPDLPPVRAVAARLARLPQAIAAVPIPSRRTAADRQRGRSAGTRHRRAGRADELDAARRPASATASAHDRRRLDRCPTSPACEPRLRPLLDMPAAASAHRIVATGHAHIDTAWLWPIRETVRKCTRTFASAVALMDEYPEYRFSCSQAQQYAWIEERHPELFEQIADKVAGGQWDPGRRDVGRGRHEPAVGREPGAPDRARPALLREPLRAPLHRGLDPRRVRLPGRACRSSTPPAGCTASSPRSCRGTRTNRFPHHTFWWEGLDGTRVLTHFPPVDTYNAEITPGEVVGSVERFQDARLVRLVADAVRARRRRRRPDPRDARAGRRMADSTARRRCRSGRRTSSSSTSSARHSNGAPVPVWRGELYFETHRGTLTSQLSTKLGNRRCERSVARGRAVGGHARPAADVDDLWREVLTQQFHDIIPGSSIAWVHADAEAGHAEVAAALERGSTQLFDELVPETPHCRQHRRRRPRRGDRDRRPRADPGSVCPANALGAASRPLAADDRVVVTDSSMANHHLAVRWDSTGHSPR